MAKSDSTGLPASELSDSDWSIFVNDILQEKCVLLLGPEILNFIDKGNFFKEIYSSKEGVTFFDRENLFLFEDSHSKTEFFKNTAASVKAFRDKKEPPIFSKLARIPFSLIITAEPFGFLQKSFYNSKFKFQSFVYTKASTAPLSNVALGTKTSPLIVDLMGSIDDFDSFILTHTDAFNYYDSILNRQKLPPEFIQRVTKGDKRLVFLGFDFEKWFVQLILMTLRLHEESTIIKQTPKFSAGNSLLICERQFKVKFVNQSLEDFVDMLYSKFDATQLRQPGKGDLITPEEIEIDIFNTKLNDAWDKLKKVLPSNDKQLQNQLTMVRFAYNRDKTGNEPKASETMAFQLTEMVNLYKELTAITSE